VENVELVTQTFRIEKKLNELLGDLSFLLGIPKVKLVNEAIRSHLNNLIDDDLKKRIEELQSLRDRKGKK
jgi:predicted DNA-binding protein